MILVFSRQDKATKVLYPILVGIIEYHYYLVSWPEFDNQVPTGNYLSTLGKHTNVSKIDIKDKLNKLVETINECIYRIEKGEHIELVEIKKLYC